MDSSTNETITLSVFISSPGDLGTTRKRVGEIIRQMGQRSIHGKQVVFEPMLYEEHTPAVVGYSPQMAVDYFTGEAGAMDIYVGMFCCRIGSPVTVKNWRYASGTLYEFDRAYSGWRLARRPMLLLYRRTQPRPEECAGNDDGNAIEELFAGMESTRPVYEGIPKSFVTDDELEKHLVPDLEQVALKIIQRGFDSGAESSEDLRGLVESVHKWLATFEDRFGEELPEDEERERDHPFPVRFRYLEDAPVGDLSSGFLPGKNESLVDVFDRMDGRMLLVGERGTGKTFGMLRMMQDLSDRAFIKRGNPVPVFFNLSSWSETFDEGSRSHSLAAQLLEWINPDLQPTGTMDKWLEDQMVRNYSLQRKVAKRLLRSNSVILCLDGLDELDAGVSGAKDEIDQSSRALRDACVKAINGTLNDNSVRMILCCREETYRELAEKPRMGKPLQTQLLSIEEVLVELRQRPNLDGLKQAMIESPVLLERSRVALFLSMMCIAYRDMDSTVILAAVSRSELDWEKHLLDHYIAQCMRLAPSAVAGNSTDCLSWLAKQPDNDFLLENMQPSLLLSDDTIDGKRAWKYYRRLSITLLAGSLMIIETIPVALATGVENGFIAGWQRGFIGGLIMFIASVCILFPLYLGAFSARKVMHFGLCFGLAWALDSSVCNYLGYSTKSDPSCGTVLNAWHMFRASLPCAVIFFTLLGWNFYERSSDHRRRYSSKVDINQHEILPIEPWNWRWFDSKAPWRGGWVGLLVGPLVLLIAWKLGETRQGFVAAPLMSLMVCMFSGLSGSGIAKVSIEPNQGIARSLSHALRMTGLFVACSVVCWGGVYYFYMGWVKGVVGVCLGFTLSFTFFIFGGIPVIKQFSLGMVLHKRGKLATWCCWPPWKATVEFLDVLVRYKLLRRTAGGYMFRHQTLREYYRSLGNLDANQG